MKHQSEIIVTRPPSLAEIIQRIQEDANFPAPRRNCAISSLRKLPEWLERVQARVPPVTADDLEFSVSSLEAVFGAIAPSALGVSRKRLQNAKSDARYVLAYYGLLAERRLPQLNPSLQALEALITDRFRAIQLTRFLRFLSEKRIEPYSVADSTGDDFRQALRRDPRVRRPDRAWRETIRAWNREGQVNTQWPQIKLSPPRNRKVWGRKWTEFPASFKAAVDAFFRNDPDCENLFDVGRARLASSTIKAQTELLRQAASALVIAGVDPQTITDLRAISTPDAFRGALQYIVDARGGVSSTAENVAHVLRKVAKLAGVLSSEEIEAVQKAHRNLLRHVRRRAFPRKDRDQQVLDKLDDARLVDAFLSLGRRTVADVNKSRVPTRQAALDIQRALALELSICAPLRLRNLVSLRLDKHFFKMTLDGVERVVVRVPGEETKNGEPAEHFLNHDTAVLLDHYVERFRPLIAKDARSWLFPGAHGSHKTENTLGTQLSLWVREELGIPYHPHLIRKIVPKLYLDADPGGLEVVRRQLGHKSDEMLRQVYLQRVHRASQKKYVEALESRRLSAFGISGAVVRRRNVAARD